jgi:hypothetical protein
VIYHNLDLNPTIATKFYSSSANYLRPNVGGLNGGGGVVVWHNDSANQYIRKALYNGSTWQDPFYGTIYDFNGGVDA